MRQFRPKGRTQPYPLSLSAWILSIPSRFSSNHPSITPMSSVFIYIYRYSASCLLTNSSIRSRLHGLTAACSLLRVSKEKRYLIFSGSIPSNRWPKFWKLLTPPYNCTFSGTGNSSSKFTSDKGFTAHAKGSGLEAVPKETEQNLWGAYHDQWTFKLLFSI